MRAPLRNILTIFTLAVFTAACGGGGDSDTPPTTNTGTGGNSPDPSPGGTSNDSPNNNSASFGEPNDSQIRPGVLVTAAGSQCTSNFIYSDTVGNYYIGAAAHCFSPDANGGVDPCEATNEALGIEVEIENAAFMGSLAYSSWQTMQDAGIPAGSDICNGNDFALVKLDSRDISNLHPSARVFGGPTALFIGDASVGDDVYTYGQSPFSLGFESAQSKQGTIEGQSDDGWVYSVTLSYPGAPGDSGSAVLHQTGKALGVLSTLNACVGLCSPTTNGIVNLEMALAYANTNAFGNSLQLVTWSEFTP